MSLFAGLGAIAGGLLGAKGASDAGDAQVEAARIAKELPEWLAPYYTGAAGAAPQPTPINYNWLDAIQNMGATGMPQAPSPMSMNDPRMTFQNVYTPYAGGPWGYGLGPGVSTLEAGIPGQGGAQFVQPPEGFVPGPVAPQSPPTADNGSGGILDPAVLEQAKNYTKWAKIANMGGGDEAPYSGPSPFDALQWAMNNPEGGYVDVYKEQSRIPYWEK